MSRWVKTICKILRSPEYPQKSGNLVVFNDHGEIVAKCALGEISCRVGLPITQDNVENISYTNILRKAKVPEVYLYGLPVLDTSTPCFIFDTIWNAGLMHYIYFLNDAGFTYGQIADFIETTFGEEK